jgi:cobalt-zinc-cadmium efflux system membrane fusion protein
MKARLGSALLFLAVLVIGGWTVYYFWKTPTAAVPAAEASEAAPLEAGVVTLPSEKVEAAGIHSVKIEKRALRMTRMVPGRIQYDDTRHIAVKAATAGALIDVKVKPGDGVSPGQILAVLSSPEVGTARAEVLQRAEELKLLQTELEWASNRQSGLQTLVKAIRERQTIDEIRTSLKETLVGKSRETMLAAYSRYQLAESLLKSGASAGDTGAISGRQVAERKNEFQTAEAALQAVSEQETFDIKQDVARAKNAVDQAQNKLKISQQLLSTLLGYDEKEVASQTESFNLSLVEVRAPFAGTIEQKMYSNSERVQLGDTLFILADTTRMWVAADLREGEWSAMGLHQGDALVVTTPAISGREFDASVYYIGREVAAQTNSVPLVASISNTDGLLRPGLFVRVRLPLSDTREVVAVPSSAICEHESRSFVFVDAGDRKYRQKFVARGIEDQGLVEITSGLSGGEQIVDQGAFALKSELLLEREE